MKHVPKIFKRTCLINSYVAFLYHGMQLPCTHNGFPASYSSGNLLCENNKDSEKKGNVQRRVYMLRRLMRYVDLSFACFMPNYLALHDRVSTRVIASVCALCGTSQTSTSLAIAAGFLLCVRRYYNVVLGKRFIFAFLTGSAVFGDCPRDKWIQRNRYIWHFCVSQTVLLAAHLMRGNRLVRG
jgi:hypothetical protein